MRPALRTFIPGNPPGGVSRTGPVNRLFLFISLLMFSLCLTILYQGMREILYLGGFVASGGPYAISHPAPGWVWIMPVSAILMVISMLVGIGLASRTMGPILMVFSWSALFLSLGWNFLEFGLGLPTDGRLAVGWLICAGFFIPMGGLPLIFILKTCITGLRTPRREGVPSRTRRIWPQLIAVAAGIWLGIAIFRSVT